MNNKYITLTASSFLGMLISATATAHVSNMHHIDGIGSGLMHSFTGIDHLLAMLAVGLLANMQKNISAFLLPVIFMLCMALGAGLSLLNIQINVEPIILVSLLVLGGLVAWRTPLNAKLSASLVALFALAHGFAHGSEIPQDAHGMLFMAGAILASGILHASGFALARILAGAGTRGLGIAAAGIGIALTGLYMAIA